MQNIGYATLSVIPSAKGFGKRLSDDVDPQMQGAGASAGKGFGAGLLGVARTFAGPLVAAFGIGAAVKFFGDSIAGASNRSESASKVGVVFGAQAAQVLAASETSAKAMGLSKTAYLDATGTLGNLLVSLKVAPDAAADMSQQMVKLAGDLASFNNVSPEQALEAIRSGLVGETEPLRQFGVNMDDASLRAQALKMNLIASTKDAMTPQTKALAAQALIMAQTGTAQGDFARTSGGLANQQRILAAQTDDLKTKVGAGLLPVMTGIVTFLNANAEPAFSAVKDAVSTFSGKVQDATSWIAKNNDALFVAASVITVVLMPAIIGMGVQSSVAAGEVVGAWVAGKVNAVSSAAAQFAAHYTVIGGWVAHAAAAVSTGVTNGIIWAQLYTEAALGAAKNVASHVLVAVSGWGAQAAAAVAAGLTTAGVWAGQALEAGLGAAKSIGALVIVGAGWIATAATATASGAAMAIAWIVGLGPVGWIIGAIVAVGAAFVLLYNKVGWFRDGVNAAWAGIKEAFRVVVDWLVGAWDRYIYGLSKIPEAIGFIFGKVGEFITAPFRLAFNAVSSMWNRTVGGLAIKVPDWVPGIGGNTFSLPRLPSLASGATILPTEGGTIVRVAEAGRPESVVDTGKLNALLDQAMQGGNTSSGTAVFNLYDADNVLLGTIHGVAINAASETSARIERQRGRATR